MKRMRIMGLCLVAVFAVGAFAASSAFALPEIIKCQANENGKYVNSSCTKKAGAIESEEQFEISKVTTKAGFTTKSGESFLETENGTKITCLSSSATGKYDYDPLAAAKEVENVISTFKSCSIPAAKAVCTGVGAAEGEIKTFGLYGPLGYINKAKKEVGQELKTEVNSILNPKKRFARFECAGFGLTEVGEGTGKGHNCIISAITSPVDEMTLTGKQLYSSAIVNTLKVQFPQKFETATTTCAVETKLGEGPWEHSIQNQEVETENEEELEILA